MFQEYPKVMRHPNHQDAVWKQGEGKGLFVSDTVMVSTEKFPNVTVFNKSQEQQYASKGYFPPNVTDADAYEEAILEAQPERQGKFQEFPKWKYHREELAVVVRDAKEEKALGEGWSDFPILASEEDSEELIQEQVVVPKIDKRSKAYKDQQRAA